MVDVSNFNLNIRKRSSVYNRGKYFYLFADLGQGIVSVKSRNREKSGGASDHQKLGYFLEPGIMKLDNGIY